MKLFFKNLKEKEEDKYFFGIQERENFPDKHGLKVFILSTAATATDKQSSNCEFSLICQLSPFTLLEFRIHSISFPDSSPQMRDLADMEEHSKKGMEKMGLIVGITRTRSLSNLIYIFTSLLPYQAHISVLLPSYSESQIFSSDFELIITSWEERCSFTT